jgi:hypothetical protein
MTIVLMVAQFATSENVSQKSKSNFVQELLKQDFIVWIHFVNYDFFV